ncbi:glycoside hydrolase family 23 protein [Cutaneotrichosporon oleaginosum]|uniref:Glycoside hydrolase family 23 protein n=1 Tax=Cutaneotrichosporon oleaginosum TaxID=879819 RepID=A0A0J0XP44_9TREE|nr:glycoside hydrolase family 23 protein [Cutaneotrichosporon oleaginosum]KLT42837.1 glycoside hydrolase family 23 protein [Cutaneotrichosporon oleaginosum]
MLASIALQESTCRPWLVGGIGEQGLMQLLGPNCDGAPNGNCQDVDFNVRRGAEYLRKRIDEHNGSVLAGLGAYNGWRIGVTAGEVYNMKNEGRCWAQPNLDYMHQMLNGWLQGKEGWKMGKWFNRNDC